MTAELVFKHYRAFKFYFQGKFDVNKYHYRIRTPPLIEQKERRFYYRIAKTLTDAQIRALFMVGFFANPSAYITEFATPEAFTRAIAFASRGENGRTLLEHELYAWHQTLTQTDCDAWLYGERLERRRAHFPQCLQDIIAQRLPLDLACLMLLIPRPELAFHWTSHWSASARTIGALDPRTWIDRLLLFDRLLAKERTGWRHLSHELSSTFWHGITTTSLAPLVAPATEVQLFA